MLTKLAAIVQSKVALAVLGAALVGGTGTAAALAATSGHSPLGLGTAQHTGSTEGTKAPHATEAADDHAHTISLEGVLKGYNASGKTISVQTKDATSPTTVSVNGSTEVNGEHANSLSDLSQNISHDVQVQATKQSNGSLLAWKITVQGADTEGNGNDDHGQGNSSQNQPAIVLGTVASIGAGSFVVTRANGSTVTVTVNSSTRFEGVAHGLVDLKKGMRVAAEGTTQSDGTVLASAVQSVASE
jgi:hypothetical protein